ncbi:hypothetical protein, partial [Porphyromonas gingivalis]|uniref:hypothetical protein n=1 Tax=Porphyromonas gingivalis TaxID=837 RepID=UPI003BAADD62
QAAPQRGDLQLLSLLTATPFTRSFYAKNSSSLHLLIFQRSQETYRHLQEVHGTQGKGGNFRRPDSYQKDETTFPYDNQIAVYGRRM